MATVLLQPIEAPARCWLRAQRLWLSGRVRTCVFVCGLAALSFALLGYHPYAEDGGIYTAAIAARIDPTLFPAEHLWVEAHTRMALFVPAAAWLLRTLHLRLEPGLLFLQIAGLFALLGATLRLARCAAGDGVDAWWPAALMAVAAGVPIAGTALYLVDPYVTARTFTTPLLLFAVAELLGRRSARALALWLAAALLHPLMGCWGGLLLLAFWLQQRRHPVRWIALLVGSVMAVGAMAYAWLPVESPLAHSLALSRGYWFLSQWRWFEWAGALVPMLGFLLLRQTRQARARGGTLRMLMDAGVASGALAILLAACFCQAGGHTSALARMQPLRTFHLLFAVLLLVGGGWLFRFLGQRRMVPAALLLLAVIGGSLFAAQRSLYPDSAHIEWPGRKPRNAWEQAFAWVRTNTERDVLLAVDAGYIDLPGEDAQGIRAATLRSVLPDRAKDGGIASVVPSLAADWQSGVAAQTGLDGATDPERRRRLVPMGVSWIVLRGTSVTGLPCPYRSSAVLVCRLR